MCIVCNIFTLSFFKLIMNYCHLFGYYLNHICSSVCCLHRTVFVQQHDSIQVKILGNPLQNTFSNSHFMTMKMYLLHKLCLSAKCFFYEGDPKSKVSIMLGLQGNCSRECWPHCCVCWFLHSQTSRCSAL